MGKLPFISSETAYNILRNYVKGDLAMENRNFQMDTQWNIIHYTEKPTGFGILIIGDERHFVDEHKFIFKKLMREITGAHQVDLSTLENEIFNMYDIINLDFDCPITIIQVLAGGKSYTQSKLYQKIINTPKINPTLILPEKKPQLG